MLINWRLWPTKQLSARETRRESWRMVSTKRQSLRWLCLIHNDVFLVATARKCQDERRKYVQERGEHDNHLNLIWLRAHSLSTTTEPRKSDELSLEHRENWVIYYNLIILIELFIKTKTETERAVVKNCWKMVNRAHWSSQSNAIYSCWRLRNVNSENS